MSDPRAVYAVHAVQPEVICPAEVLPDDWGRAEEHASSVSADPACWPPWS
jgi:hypothetical protein